MRQNKKPKALARDNNHVKIVEFLEAEGIKTKGFIRRSMLYTKGWW